MIRKALMAAAAALFLAGRPAMAQSHESFVGAQLDVIEVMLAQDGWRRADDFTGDLSHGRRGVAVARLSGGTQYLVVGACDRDCGDLDLSLQDAWGTVRSLDVKTDALPSVGIEFADTRLRVVQVNVQMEHCAVNPCAYGLAVFRRR